MIQASYHNDTNKACEPVLIIYFANDSNSHIPVLRWEPRFLTFQPNILPAEAHQVMITRELDESSADRACAELWLPHRGTFGIFERSADGKMIAADCEKQCSQRDYVNRKAILKIFYRNATGEWNPLLLPPQTSVFYEADYVSIV